MYSKGPLCALYYPSTCTGVCLCVGVVVCVSVCVGLWVSSVTAFNKHFGSKKKKVVGEWEY